MGEMWESLDEFLTSSVAFFQLSLYRKTVKNADCVVTLIKNPNHIPATVKEKKRVKS